MDSFSDISCPSCFKSIPATQSYEGVYICECGQRVASRNPNDKAASKSSFWLVVLGIFVLAGFLHAANWDNHFFEIIPLKTKQLLGVASLNELEKIAAICEDRKKNFCQEQALSEAFAIDNKKRDRLIKIAELQISRSGYEDSTNTLSKYFKAGGKDRLARYNLAVSLAKTGKTTEAKKQLHYLVFSTKGSLDAQAARTYVSLLMESGDYQTAQKVVRHCRGLGNNTAMFLETEWKEIQKKLKVASSRNSV